MEDIQLYGAVNGAKPQPIKEFEVAPRQDTSVSKRVKKVPKSPTITLTFYNPFPTSSPIPEWAKATIMNSGWIKANWSRNIAQSHWGSALNNK